MERTGHLRLGTRVLALALAGVVLGGSYVRADHLADHSDHKTFKERQHERGDFLRERAKEKARAPLAYETVGAPDANRHYDFQALGLQIARLAALIQQLGMAAGTGQGKGFVPLPPPAWAGALSAPGAGVGGVYGPAGPSEKSVRLLLEYRLMVAGNPRLRVGAVKDGGDRVTASVVTADGSVVEEYVVDKKSGVWTPVR